MSKIIEILYVEDKGEYKRTHAQLSDGTEAVAYGDGFKVGQEVEVFLDLKWNVIKFKEKKNGRD